MTENSYQSARKDAVRAAAVLGAGYLAYKGYKKLSNGDWDLEGCMEVGLFLVCLPALVATGILFLPYYLYWRFRIPTQALRKLKEVEVDLETATNSLGIRESELRQLPVETREIELQLEPLRKELAKRWRRTCLQASLALAALGEEHEHLERHRQTLLSKSGSYSKVQLAAKLRRAEEKMKSLNAQRDEISEVYEAQPAKGVFLLDEFFEQHKTYLGVSFALLFVSSILISYVLYG